MFGKFKLVLLQVRVMPKRKVACKDPQYLVLWVKTREL